MYQRKIKSSCLQVKGVPSGVTAVEPRVATRHAQLCVGVVVHVAARGRRGRPWKEGRKEGRVALFKKLAV